MNTPESNFLERVPQDLIYHYTSVDALLSILETNSFWASDFETANDPAELVHIRDLLDDLCVSQGIGDAICRMLAGQSIKPTEIPSVMSGSEREYRKFALQVVDLINKQDAHHWKDLVGRVFGVSFCSQGDLLSQWRGYGLSGSGVCIGFDLRLLSKCFEDSIQLVKVQYDLDEQRKTIQALLAKAYGAYCKMLHGVSPEHSVRYPGPQDIALEASTELILSEMAAIAHSFKKPGFSEEQEYRAVKRLAETSHEIDGVQLRAKANKLIPYLSLSPISGKLPIRVIIKGPSQGSENADYALQVLLKRLGHGSVEIRESKYKLR